MSEGPYVSGEQNSEAAAQVEFDQNETSNAGAGESRQVPLDALQAEKAERQRLQDEVKMMKDHMSLIQAQQQYQKQQPAKDEFEGISKDDVITYGDLEKILSKKEKQYQMNIQELKMTQKYPDYQKIVTEYLPDVLKQNPSLRDTLVSSQDYELAYYLAKNSDSYKKSHKQVKQNADAERIVQNAQRAGSLSSVGQTSPINEARKYKEMSDADFKKQAQKNLGYF